MITQIGTRIKFITKVFFIVVSPLRIGIGLAVGLQQNWPGDRVGFVWGTIGKQWESRITYRPALLTQAS